MEFKVFKDFLNTVWIAWIWWASHYLYNVYKWQKFNIIMFLINIFLAWFVWYIIQWILPPDFSMIWPVCAISWFSAFPILALIEENYPKILEKYFNKKID
jgi:hypothetical protein